MDIPGASYFFTLAQVGITFSGFAAMLMALRQMHGASMSKFHLWVARSYVQAGLVTAMDSLLAPLFYGIGLSLSFTWQAASAFIALQSLVLIGRVPKQWRHASDRPLHMRVKIHMALGIFINAMLLANAAGWPYPPAGGMVMFAISWNLFAFFVQFAESINFFVRHDEETDEE